MNQQNRAKVVNTNSQVVPKTKAIMAEVDEYSVFDLMAIMSPASDTTMFRKSRSTYAIIILKCKCQVFISSTNTDNYGAHVQIQACHASLL